MGAEAPEPIAALASCYIARRYGSLAGTLELPSSCIRTRPEVKKNIIYQQVNQYLMPLSGDYRNDLFISLPSDDTF